MTKCGCKSDGRTLVQVRRIQSATSRRQKRCFLTAWFRNAWHAMAKLGHTGMFAETGTFPADAADKSHVWDVSTVMLSPSAGRGPQIAKRTRRRRDQSTLQGEVPKRDRASFRNRLAASRSFCLLACRGRNIGYSTSLAAAPKVTCALGRS